MTHARTRTAFPQAPRVAAALAGMAAGAFLVALNAVSADLFGAGPAMQAGVLGAAALGTGLPRPTLNSLPARALTAAAGASVIGAPWLLGLCSPTMVPGLAVAAGTLGVWSVTALTARAEARARGVHTASILLGSVVSAVSAPAPAVLAALTLALAAATLAGGPPAPGRADRTPHVLESGARIIVFSSLCLTGLVAWSALRGPLQPSPSGFGAWAAAAWLTYRAGRAISARTASIGAAVLSGLTAAALITGPLDARMAAITQALGQLPGPLAALQNASGPALLVLGAVGACTGLALGAARPRGASIGVGLASAALVPALALFGTAHSRDAGTALVTLGGDPTLHQRVDAARRTLPLQYAAVTPVGAALTYAREGDRLIELDGAVLDPSGRGVTAERFAGTLGACLVSGRDRARVAGDDLGVVVQALLAQGFHGVDTAVPDTAGMRVWSELDSGARDAWVHPATRILTLPGAFVAQRGADADLIVNVLRNGWTDGRAALPSAASLARARRTLNPGGALVVAMTTVRASPDAVLGVAGAMARAFPQLTVWLPPVGVDTALLVGRTGTDPLAFGALDACVRNDAVALRRTAVRSAADLAGLLLGDGSTLPDARTVTGYALPDRIGLEANALTRVRADGWDPAPLWSADAPADALRERHDALLRFQQVIARAGSGDVQGAVRDARTLSQTPGGGRSVETLVRGYLDSARALIARGAKEGPDSRAWGAAETALGNARLLYPELAEASCVAGSLDEARGRGNLAEDAYNDCLTKDADSLEALDGLARVRRARGDRSGAEQALRLAVERHPQEWKPKLNLGNLYTALGRTSEAETLIREAVAGAAREEPSPVEPHLALAHLYLMTERPAQALGEAGLVVQKRPSAFAYCVRAAARFDLNQLDLAEADFRRGLELSADNVLCRGGLGGVQMVRRDYDGAAASFKAVLRVDPQNAEARANLQRLQELGQTD